MDEAIKTPQDMRRELQEAARGLWGLSQRERAYDFTSATVRSCLDAGRHNGWSGEDTYTVMAYQLHKSSQTFGAMVLNQLRNEPPRPLMINEPPGWRILLRSACDYMQRNPAPSGPDRGQPTRLKLIGEITDALEAFRADKT